MGMVVKAQNSVSVRDIVPDRAVPDSTSSVKDDFNRLLETKKEQLNPASADSAKETGKKMPVRTPKKADSDTEGEREDTVDSGGDSSQNTLQQAGLEQSLAQMAIMVAEPEQEIFIGVFKSEAKTEQAGPVEEIPEAKLPVTEGSESQIPEAKAGAEQVQPYMAGEGTAAETVQKQQEPSFFERKPAVPEEPHMSVSGKTTEAPEAQQAPVKVQDFSQAGDEKEVQVQTETKVHMTSEPQRSLEDEMPEKPVITEAKAGVAELREERITDAAREPKADEKQPEEKGLVSELMFRKVAESSRKEEPGPGAGGQENQSRMSESGRWRIRGLADHENEERISIYGDSGFRLSGQYSEMPTIGYKAGEMPLKTTPQTLPEDLGKALASRMPENSKTLTVELEPASLGKLTIKMIYEGGRAAVSIMASNPRTLELLNQRASEIAAILEEKTGQQTIIYTHESQQGSEEQLNQEHHSRQERDAEEERRRNQDEKGSGSYSESFAHQLRLGLV